MNIRGPTAIKRKKQEKKKTKEGKKILKPFFMKVDPSCFWVGVGIGGLSWIESQCIMYLYDWCFYCKIKTDSLTKDYTW